MSAQPFRNPDGGLIDRSRPLDFTFNGQRLQGYAGDTLASALLANGVRLVGRSYKYHRPRGIFGAGAEEPNALVQLGLGGRTEPNTRATEIALFEGLSATSQNCWPSVGFDTGAVNNLLSAFLPAGFYNKTFMWPTGLWGTYERFLRNAAGLGTSPLEPDPARYEHRYFHCEVMVVGGGPAGLAAALAAGRSGGRVLLVDDQPVLGGHLGGTRDSIDGRPAADWVAGTVNELAAMSEVTLLNRATAFGYYDHGMITVLERVQDHLGEPDTSRPRQRMWWVRAAQVVLATGAIERPLVFADNDRPGVMLASAARTYVNRYAVRPGSRAVVFTNNDSAYGAALDLAAGGVRVAAVVDVRAGGADAAAAPVLEAGIECMKGHAVVASRGRKKVRGARVMALDEGGATRQGTSVELDCDLICLSGGWNPTVHLFSQSGGKVVYDQELTAFVPGRSVQADRSCGGAKGDFRLGACIRGGYEAGAAAAVAAGCQAPGTAPDPTCDESEENPVAPLWTIPLPPGMQGKRFVDFQGDVDVCDVALAAREGYRSVEHLKRYTALGMGTDQGRTSNVNGLAILAAVTGRDIPAVGTTTFRPPFMPVPLGAFAGREVGAHMAPTRRSAVHEWHEKAGAVFVNVGQWLRPQYYPRPDESVMEAIQREAADVRAGVGMVDVSTLGKIDIQGPDASEFLNRVYINGWKKLAIGRCRYGVMLREDGMVLDDGTTSRLAENRFLMTTTTVHAGAVMTHLELDVHVVSVTEEWTAIALAGPDSRRVLAKVTDDIALGNEEFPFMGIRQGTIAGIPGRVFRISFSGELAFEVNVPADHGRTVWERMMAAGEEYNITPYGTEAQSILRIEKGHVVGGEINGRTTAGDLGFGGMLSKAKDFIGKRSLTRPGLDDEHRKQLVGLVSTDGQSRIPRGAQIVADPSTPPPVPMLGEVTSNCHSPALGRPVALALLAAGRARQGESLYALSPVTGESVSVMVTEPVFVDPERERLRA